MSSLQGKPTREDISGNLAALLLRMVLGGLVAGHGAQKLFGSFSGPGLEGTTNIMENLELTPAAGSD